MSYYQVFGIKMLKNKTLKRKPQFVVLLTIHFTFLWKKESFGGNEMRDLF